MLNQETIIKLAEQHGFKVGRDAGGEYVAPKYEDAVGSLVALVQAAYALGQETKQAEPSQWRNEVKQLVSKYWDIAYQEGKSGENLADQANDILCQLDTLLAQQPAGAVPGAIELLREMEWENNRFADACPVCASNRKQGHAADCKLAAVLAAAQKGGA
ncbi:MAG: hypothetical protein ACK4FZ_15280 [Vogesella sp.]|uniref:hypothetical protein n=1 Tax=Vogesella sp. TaxID=1904252 RepID=UPI00391BE445